MRLPRYEDMMLIILIVSISAATIVICGLEDRISVLEQQIVDLQARADHTGMKQAVLDVKFRILTGEFGPVTTRSAPAEFEGLKE